jgi:hypothetical protein
MKKAILGAVTGVALAGAAVVGYVGYTMSQEWQKVYTDGDLKSYISAATIKVENPGENIRSAWNKSVFSHGGFTTYQLVVNCDTNEYYNRSASSFDSQGAFLQKHPDETEWDQAVPGTNVMLAINKICK